MEQEQYHFAWRTPIGEKKPNLRHCCTWYYCADKNMENEMVLVYAVEKTKELKNTNLKHEDRFLQTMTASGKPYWKVTKFAKIAVSGSYNQENHQTIKKIDQINDDK